MADPVVRLEGIVAGYGATHVLKDINLSIARGERLAVLGRNGVGKTTLLATIMGLTTLHTGRVFHEGDLICGYPTHIRARRGLGLVPQTRDIFRSLTVEENLIAGLRNGARLDEAYTLFPRLRERRANRGNHLSGGEQQMLSIARALMGKPKVLLLDEPLEGLAPVICDMLMDAFHKLAASGDQTLVLVEQQTVRALAFAERVIVLDQGALVYDGRPDDIAVDPSLLSRYIGVDLG